MATVNPSTTPRSAFSLLNDWWALIIRGVLAIIFGVLAIAWPQITLVALIALFAAYALLDGVTSIAAAVRDRTWGWQFFGGLLGVLAGVLTILWPAVTGIALVFLIGAWAIARGVIDIGMAIALRKEIRHEWLLALGGLISIAFGIFLLIWPNAGALAVVGVIAFWAIFLGVLLISAGIRQRGLHHRRTETSAPAH